MKDKEIINQLYDCAYFAAPAVEMQKIIILLDGKERFNIYCDFLILLINNMNTQRGVSVACDLISSVTIDIKGLNTINKAQEVVIALIGAKTKCSDCQLEKIHRAIELLNKNYVCKIDSSPSAKIATDKPQATYNLFGMHIEKETTKYYIALAAATSTLLGFVYLESTKPRL